MANVWAKLGQAAFFLQEMERLQANRRKFTYELSAFLGTCQSVVYYLAKEQPEGWYKQLLLRAKGGEFPYFAYYHSKRHEDVHEEILEVFGMSTVKVDARLPRPAAPYVRMTKDDDGNILDMVWDDGQGPPTPLEFTQEHRYYFLGSESTEQDILAECVEYYMELRSIALQARHEHAGH